MLHILIRIMAIPHFSKGKLKTHSNAPNKQEDPAVERIVYKVYLVKWKNQQPDTEGYYRIRTEFCCDVRLLTPFLLTLPQGDYDFICVTDEKERLEIESNIRYHEECLHKLRNQVVIEEVDAVCAAPSLAPQCDEEKDEYNPDRRTFRGYFQSVTLYNKDGKDNGNGYYDKEEIRRFSVRTLMLNEIIEDFEKEELAAQG